jgi:tetratricopeptide (TPR) repeat protein
MFTFSSFRKFMLILFSDSGPLVVTLLAKFGLKEVSGFNRTVNSSEMFRLLLAVQYHTGARLRDECDFKLCCPRTPMPFTLADLYLNGVRSDDAMFPSIKSVAETIVVPGPAGRCVSHQCKLPEAFMCMGLFDHAIDALRIRLSLLGCLSSSGFVSEAPKQFTAYAFNVYLLALALHLNANSDNSKQAIDLIRLELGRIPKYCAISCKLMTLLACIQLSAGSYEESMFTFDASTAAHNCVFGCTHPMTVLHMVALADAYRCLGSSVGGKQARVLMTVALELSGNGIGADHAVTLGYAHKLAVLSIEQGDHSAAIELLDRCIPALEQAQIKFPGSSARHDLQHCLFLKAAALTELKSIDEAIKCCNKLLSIGGVEVTSQKRDSAVTATELSGLVLLSDLNVRCKDLDTAKTLLARAQSLLVTQSTHDGTLDRGISAARLTLKMLNLELASLSRQTRLFSESIGLETIQEAHVQAQAKGGTSSNTSKASSIESATVRLTGAAALNTWTTTLHKLLDDLWSGNPNEVMNNAIQEAIRSEHEHGEIVPIIQCQY